MEHVFCSRDISVSRYRGTQYRTRLAALTELCYEYLNPGEELADDWIFDMIRCERFSLVETDKHPHRIEVAVLRDAMRLALMEADTVTYALRGGCALRRAVFRDPRYAAAAVFFRICVVGGRSRVLAEGDPEGFISVARQRGCLDKIITILTERGDAEEELSWIVQYCDELP